MNRLKITLLIIFTLWANCTFYAQEATATPQRTPEQEATRQTEKLQQELNLSEEQVKQVHEINLKYARERQVSNSRTEALQRVKNKESDLQRILQPEQYHRLQNKQFDRSPSSSPEIKRTTPVQSPNFRSNSTLKPAYRTGAPVRNTFPRHSSTPDNRSQDKQAPTRNPAVTPGRQPIENSRTPANTQNERTTQPTQRRSEGSSSHSSGSENRRQPAQVERSSGSQTPTRSGSQSSGRR